MSKTAYFSDKTFRFQRALARNNNREWFAAHKPDYEEHLLRPFQRLLTDLQGPLTAISAEYRSDSRGNGGSLFRIHRDTRFSNDKTPYKTWAGARLFHQRAKQTPAPSFYIHIQPGGHFIGAGIWHPEPPTQKRIREFMADNPAAWTKAVHSSAFKKKYTLGGDTLVRPPRGFDPKHPLIEDIKRKDFVASVDLTDADVLGTGLLRRIETDLRGLAPLVDYLCAALDLEF